MPLLEVGSVFPPPEDRERLHRYEQLRLLWSGEHMNMLAAQRLQAKLAEDGKYTPELAEGVVYLVINLAQNIASKFADLMVSQQPTIRLQDATPAQEDAFREDLDDDVPMLWAEVHYALEMARALGDTVLSVRRDAPVGDQNGGVDLRAIDPGRWFPVVDDSDPMTFVAHQIAWCETRKVGKKDVEVLRVQVSERGRWRERAFVLAGRYKQDPKGAVELKEEITGTALYNQLWPGLVPETTDGVPEGEFLIVHIPNGRMRAASPFGRSDFQDAVGIFDNLNWSVSKWSDANDKVAHPPRIIPNEFLQINPDAAGVTAGAVMAPGKYRQVFSAASTRTDQVPQYMGFELSHETLLAELDATVRLICARCEMPVALIGWDLGRQKESGEAKALGLSTAEVSAMRQLVRVRPQVNKALGLLAALRTGERKAPSVNTIWRVGLPKSQAELDAEVIQKYREGFLTKEDAIAMMNPDLTPDEVKERVRSLDSERQKQLEAEGFQFGGVAGR